MASNVLSRMALGAAGFNWNMVMVSAMAVEVSLGVVVQTLSVRLWNFAL